MTERTVADARALRELQKVPNVGPAIAEDLLSLGVRSVSQLARRDHRRLYDRLCDQTGMRQDPCVLDTFEAAVAFARGGPPLPWWHYSRLRKARESQAASSKGSPPRP